MRLFADFEDVASESPPILLPVGTVFPPRLRAKRKIEQFVEFYYQTFDDNRPALAALYVRPKRNNLAQ